MLPGRVVFHMPDLVHHVLSAGRILFKNTLEAYMEHHMQSKLQHVLQEHRVVSLVTQLRGQTAARRASARVGGSLTPCFLPQTPCSARAAPTEPRRTDTPGPSRRLRR